jgi:hypothetical protein
MSSPREQTPVWYKHESQWNDIPSIGRVPGAPRADRIQRRRLSPQSSRPRRLRSPSRSSRRNETYTSDDPNPGERASAAENANPWQLMANLSERCLQQRFAARMREMRQITRQKPIYGPRTRENAKQREQQFNFYSRDRQHYRPTEGSVVHTHHPEVKQEDSTEHDHQDHLFVPESSQPVSSSRDVESSNSGGEGEGEVSKVNARRDDAPAPKRNFPLPGRISPHCICPIGFECPAKHDLFIDCRKLVVEHNYWLWLHKTDTVP